MGSVLGTILDPAADKMLMTTLVVTLAAKDLIPGMPISLLCPLWLLTFGTRAPVPLAAIILGRDVLLSLTAFYIRYTTLPTPVSASPAPCHDVT